MRCLSCREDVDKTRVIPISAETADRYPPGTYFKAFHLRFVPGVLPVAPDTTSEHVGPVICGPLEGD